MVGVREENIWLFKISLFLNFSIYLVTVVNRESWKNAKHVSANTGIFVLVQVLIPLNILY